MKRLTVFLAIVLIAVLTLQSAGTANAANGTIPFSMSSIPTNGDRINVMTKGVKNDGRDQRALIQSIINSAKSGSTIYFPKGKYGIGGTLRLKSNLTLEGAGESTVIQQMKKNVKTIEMNGLDRIRIHSMKFSIDGIYHTSEQTNHTIAGYNMQNIILEDLVFTGLGTNKGDMRHDPIYFRTDVGTKHPTKNIVIRDVDIRQWSRNGIAIAGAENVLIENVHTGSRGKAGNAAIDLEPAASRTVKNVTIRNVVIDDDDFQATSFQGLVDNVKIDNMVIKEGEFVLRGNVKNITTTNSEARALISESDSRAKAQATNIVFRDTLFDAEGYTSFAAMVQGYSYTFDGVTFTGGDGYGIRDKGMKGSLVVKNSTFKNNKSYGVYVTGASSAVIKDNTFTGQRWPIIAKLKNGKQASTSSNTMK